MTEDDLKKAEAIAKSIGIPSQPQVAVNILHEINKPNPDLVKIAKLASEDVSMLARIIKVVNSPFFSRGQFLSIDDINSILHALNIIGIRNFYLIVLLSALEDVLQEINLNLEKFWRHSKAVAAASASIARKLKLLPEDQAYIAGLFHDCGVALLLKKFPNYIQIIDHALYTITLQPLSEKFESIIGYENVSYNTNHCVMGYIMAKSWKLSDTITQVILHHHSGIEVHKDPFIKKLSAILHLSEFICQTLTLTGAEFTRLTLQWEALHKKTLKELGLNTDNITADIQHLINEVQNIIDEQPE
jgi:putative nucleotidyltransferase with HDIG domain